MTPLQITPPAIEPVSLAEQKAWLRVDDAREDDIIAALVTSARVLVEKATRLCLITQTWRFTLDGWPHSTADRGPRWLNRVEVRLPIAPFQSVVAVRVLDALGDARDVAAAEYVVAPAFDAARIRFTGDPPTPGVSMGGISIDVVAGYGDASRAVPEPQRLAEAIQAQLKEVGIRVTLDPLEFAVFLRKVRTGGHDMCLIGWTGDNGDPDNFYYTLLDQDAAVKGQAQNFAFWRDPEFHRLMLAGQSNTDDTQRDAIYRQAGGLVHDQVPVVPIVHTSVPIVLKSSLEGFVPSPSLDYHFETMHVGK